MELLGAEGAGAELCTFNSPQSFTSVKWEELFLLPKLPGWLGQPFHIPLSFGDSSPHPINRKMQFSLSLSVF